MAGLRKDWNAKSGQTVTDDVSLSPNAIPRKKGRGGSAPGQQNMVEFVRMGRVQTAHAVFLSIPHVTLSAAGAQNGPLLPDGCLRQY